MQLTLTPKPRFSLLMIMVALIYWVMCIIMQSVQERIETRMARGDRRTQ